MRTSLFTCVHACGYVSAGIQCPMRTTAKVDFVACALQTSTVTKDHTFVVLESYHSLLLLLHCVFCAGLFQSAGLG